MLRDDEDAMADEHRRVEPRAVIVGSGMAADPEAIRDLEHDHERMERAWRDQPKESFGEVLSHTPAKGELVDAEEETPARPTQAHVRAPDPRMQALHARFGSVPEAHVHMPTPKPAPSSTTPATASAPTDVEPASAEDDQLAAFLAEAEQGASHEGSAEGDAARKRRAPSEAAHRVMTSIGINPLLEETGAQPLAASTPVGPSTSQRSGKRAKVVKQKPAPVPVQTPSTSSVSVRGQGTAAMLLDDAPSSPSGKTPRPSTSKSKRKKPSSGKDKAPNVQPLDDNSGSIRAGGRSKGVKRIRSKGENAVDLDPRKGGKR